MNQNPKPLSPTTEQALQSFLVDGIQGLQALQKLYPEELNNISIHLHPDGCYASIEHDLNDRATNQLIRLSPACHTILTKL